MNEEHTYKGSKTKNYFSAYLLASVQGRRKRYLDPCLEVGSDLCEEF